MAPIFRHQGPAARPADPAGFLRAQPVEGPLGARLPAKQGAIEAAGRATLSIVKGQDPAGRLPCGAQISQIQARHPEGGRPFRLMRFEGQDEMLGPARGVFIPGRPGQAGKRGRHGTPP